jgi:hypothetical protein
MCPGEALITWGYTQNQDSCEKCVTPNHWRVAQVLCEKSDNILWIRSEHDYIARPRQAYAYEFSARNKQGHRFTQINADRNPRRSVLICGPHFWIVRKILITVGALFVASIAILGVWIFFGRQVSLFIDHFGTIPTASAKVHSIAYEGSGTGGWLTINDVHLSLNHTSPNIALSIGSTKDDQVALASGGKIFAFGPPISTKENAPDYLAAAPQSGDEASLVTRHSVLSWPTPFEFNFMTGHSPSWKRHRYYQLRWKKSSGATLDMLWRYDQFFYGQQLVPGDGWGSGFTVHEGSTGLVRVDIKE